MKKIIIAGGTGFLGNCLSSFFLSQGYQVHVLSRKRAKDHHNLHYHQWDGKNLGSWTESLEGSEALINLTGKSVDCRYTEKNKRLIYSSRLESTAILGEALRNCKNPPEIWINAASATIYRHSLDKPMDEKTGEAGKGFSVDVCQKWEKTFNDQKVGRTRKVLLRTAIVLGKNGGAFQPLRKLAQLGLGGKQGDGNQFFSWIHERDFVNIVNHIIKDKTAEGVYNLSSPNPITNSLLMEQLRRALHMPIGLPLPVWALRIGARIIHTETELILKSRYVIPQRLLDERYVFEFTGIKETIDDLLS